MKIYCLLISVILKAHLKCIVSNYLLDEVQKLFLSDLIKKKFSPGMIWYY